MMAHKKYTVAIVDDHFGIRDGYRNLISRLDFVSGTQTFASGKELFSAMKYSPFDLVLLDVELKGENGIDICNQIKTRYKTTRVLIFSAYHSEEYMVSAERNQADGYLLKDSEPREVKKAIEKILVDEEKYFTAEAMQAILEYERLHNNPGHAADFSTRELQVIRMICAGKTNKDIGIMLNRDEKTIAKHRQNIMKKMNVHKSVEVINYAIAHGLYVPGKTGY
jgi:two-component system nitrate/nitrite response regulator NarL